MSKLSEAAVNGLCPSLDRRAFVGAGAVCLLMAGVGAYGLASGEPDATFVRPPGAASNASLLASCDRCNRCVQACPQGIIVPLQLSEGIVTYGTPTLAFSQGRCDFCMKCVEACPTGALAFGGERERDMGVAVIVSDACVAWEWSGCTVCHDECPVMGAITLDEKGRPEVHPDYCDGCGTCEAKCPSSSLRSYNPKVHEKGIVVVSRESMAAPQRTLTTDQFRAMENVPAVEGPLAPHDKGVHLDGPDGTRTAGGIHEDE